MKRGIMKKNRLMDKLINKLDLYRPSEQEMLREIAQSGLSVSLENADIDFIEKHKLEIIVSMWKVVRMAKMVDENNFNINLISEKYSDFSLN